MFYTVIRVILGFVVFFYIQNPGFSQEKKYTPQTYIDQHKELAQKLMSEFGVPASVILGVAYHESAYGNSRIARQLKNHFGVKGKNNNKIIKSAYKDYIAVEDSYRDFIDILQRRQSTKGLFNSCTTEDYSCWLLGISRSGYSRSKDWTQKITTIINRYNLHQYDSIQNH